jgi:hypothetical protein
MYQQQQQHKRLLTLHPRQQALTMWRQRVSVDVALCMLWRTDYVFIWPHEEEPM